MDFVMSVYPYINIIIGNDLEAKAFSEGNKWKLNSIEDIAHKMSTLHVEHIGHRLIIITQSEKPVIVVESKILH
ncbi:Ribokinase-like,Carbohydrate kinase PfkB [Cinara cedri]|uniref:Adenosine kinase n=1 Tax=Cinara cedri TaxID=506608 RepID=A0A5E4MCI3_9HEMI|nr:Ribokinase-like,Carbohydrate kinase PfkB [Cinara cedri]